jgi:hypothetical protein
MKYRQRLCIADLPFEISVVRPAIAHFLKVYFKGYQTEFAPVFTVFIETKEGFSGRVRWDRVVPELAPASPGHWNILNNDKTRMVVGAVDEKECACTLGSIVCSDINLLSSAIRLCVQFFLERNDGFFLHAACGTIGGKGILFTGKPTAGKSAGLHNLRPDTVVSEDAAAIRIMHDGLRVFAIPFRGEPPSSMPLTAIVFPRKWRGAHGLIRHKPAAIASELTANALFCAPSSEILMSVVLKTISQCSLLVPAYDCRFDKSTDLIPLFNEYGIFD